MSELFCERMALTSDEIRTRGMLAFVRKKSSDDLGQALLDTGGNDIKCTEGPSSSSAKRSGSKVIRATPIVSKRPNKAPEVAQTKATAVPTPKSAHEQSGDEVEPDGQQVGEDGQPRFRTTAEEDSFLAELEKELFGTVDKGLIDVKDTDEEDDTDDPVISNMKAAVETGFDLRSRFGQKFARSTTGGKNPSYRGSQVQKAQFRKDWLKTELENTTRTKTKTQTQRTIESNGGVYLPAARVLKKEGGKDDPDAVTATENYIRECYRRKGIWLKYNTFTKRIEYLYVQSSRREEFEDAIALAEIESTTGHRDKFSAKPTINPCDIDKPKEVTNIAEKSKQDDGKKSKQDDGKKCNHDNGEKGDNGTPKPKHKATKGPLDEAWAHAACTKKKFEEAVAKANAIADIVQNDPSWLWMNNDVVLADFEKARKALLTGRTAFSREVLAHDMKHIKAAYKDKSAELQIELTKFVQEVSKPIERLIAEIACLKAIHGAKQMVSS